jgi:hypothetical protein
MTDYPLPNHTNQCDSAMGEMHLARFFFPTFHRPDAPVRVVHDRQLSFMIEDDAGC